MFLEYTTRDNYLERDCLLSNKITNGTKNNKEEYTKFKNYIVDKKTGLTLLILLNNVNV